MTIAPARNLACLIDGEPLLASGRALVCSRGHSFDRAREGYWNLLLVQHKASRDPGDSREMVAARRRHVDAGHFAPLADAVVARVDALLHAHPVDRPFRLLDAGCGEGYILDRLATALSMRPVVCTAELAGCDVSKWAVQAAARRTSAITWAVANNRHLPFQPASVDLILCLFGFPVWEGFRPVQRPGGHVLLVDPGPDHLVELRRVIYPEVRRSGPPSLEAAVAHGWRQTDTWPERFTMPLASAAEIADLVAMTPHAHRMSVAGREALAKLDRLDLTADVVIRLLRFEADQPG